MRNYVYALLMLRNNHGPGQAGPYLSKFHLVPWPNIWVHIHPLARNSGPGQPICRTLFSSNVRPDKIFSIRRPRPITFNYWARKLGQVQPINPHPESIPMQTVSGQVGLACSMSTPTGFFFFACDPHCCLRTN